MSNNSSKLFSPVAVLIVAGLLGLASVALHYSTFLSEVLSYPLAVSLKESWNFVYALKLSSLSQTEKFLSGWNFASSPAFVELLIVSTKILGKEFNLANITFIFQISRVLSLVGLVGSLLVFYSIQKREDIKPLASLLSLVIILSVPIVQEFCFRSGGGSLGLMFGLCAIYRFMTYVRKDGWQPAILIGSCLALSFIFSHNLAYLAFPLACFIILWGVKNQKAFWKVFSIFSFFLGLDLIVSSRLGVLSPFTGWNLGLWNGNLGIFYSWSVFAFVLLFLFFTLRKFEFETNPIHPSNTIVLFVLPVNFLLSGMTLDNLDGWVLFVFALLWMGAIFINKLLESQLPSGINLLSCLMFFVMLLTPLLPPELIVLLQEKPGALEATQEWLKQNTIPEKKKSKRKKRSKQIQIFSQDPTFNLITKTSKEEIYDPIELYNNPSLSNKIEKAFLEQRFDKVIKCKYLALPLGLEDSIKTRYIPQKEIILAGSLGAVYLPGIPSDEQNINSTETDVDNFSNQEEGFATFSRKD